MMHTPSAETPSSSRAVDALQNGRTGTGAGGKPVINDRVSRIVDDVSDAILDVIDLGDKSPITSRKGGSSRNISNSKFGSSESHNHQLSNNKSPLTGKLHEEYGASASSHGHSPYQSKVSSSALNQVSPTFIPKVTGTFGGLVGTHSTSALSAISMGSGGIATSDNVQNIATGLSTTTPSHATSPHSTARRGVLSRPASAQRRRPSLTPGLEIIPENKNIFLEIANSLADATVSGAGATTSRLMTQTLNVSEIKQSNAKVGFSASSDMLAAKEGLMNNNLHSSYRELNNGTELSNAPTASNIGHGSLKCQDIHTIHASCQDPQHPIHSRLAYLLSGAGSRLRWVGSGQPKQESTSESGTGGNSFSSKNRNQDEHVEQDGKAVNSYRTTAHEGSIYVTNPKLHNEVFKDNAKMTEDRFPVDASTNDTRDLERNHHTSLQQKGEQSYAINEFQANARTTVASSVTVSRTLDTNGVQMPVINTTSNNGQDGEDDEPDIDRISSLGVGLGANRRRRSLSSGGLSALGTPGHGGLWGAPDQPSSSSNSPSSTDYTTYSMQNTTTISTFCLNSFVQQQRPWVTTGMFPQNITIMLYHIHYITSIHISGSGFTHVIAHVGVSNQQGNVKGIQIEQCMIINSDQRRSGYLPRAVLNIANSTNSEIKKDSEENHPIPANYIRIELCQGPSMLPGLRTEAHQARKNGSSGAVQGSDFAVISEVSIYYSNPNK